MSVPVMFSIFQLSWIQTYLSEIAPARTFTLYEDIEELLKLGKIRGGSLDSAL